MNHLNRLLDEKRYFRSKLVILHNDLFPTDVLKEIEKHQIKDQDFGIYSDAVAAIVKQIDFIQDELARNHIQFVFRDVEGNFHFLMDDMKALVQEGELTLPNHLWIYFDTYYIGRIDFGVERKDRAPRAAERSLLTDLNGKAGTFEVSASEMIPKKETDTLEHARKYLIDQLKLIKAKFPLYVLIKNAPVPVDDEFLNLIVANTLPNKPRTFYISREREITFIIQKLDRVPRTDLTVNPNQEAAQWYFKSKDQ